MKVFKIILFIVEYLTRLLETTERLLCGEQVDLPELSPTPSSMTSQLDRELRADVQTRYKRRFSLAQQPIQPEPLHAASTSGAAATPSTSGLQVFPKRKPPAKSKSTNPTKKKK